jgi:hypothetical protein
MNYPYNAIFSRGLLNIFEAALHSLYLCLKVLATLGEISVYGHQKDARNIEQHFALGHRNVNCLQDEKSESASDASVAKSKVSLTEKPTIEPECETKRVLIDPRVSHPVFKAKTRCSSYVCPGSSCHTYGQNVSTEYQCLYYNVSYYNNLLQVQKGLNSGMDPILPHAVDRGFRTPRRNLHQSTPHHLSSKSQ